MSKISCAAIVLAIVAFAVLSVGFPRSSANASIHDTTSPTGLTSTSFMATTDIDLAIWMRLRWIFLGSAAAGIVLLSIRQLRLFVRYQPMRSGTDHVPDALGHRQPNPAQWRDERFGIAGGD